MNLIYKTYAAGAAFLQGNLIIRYALSGGSASLIDLGLLYILTDLFGVYYLLSAAIASVTSFVVRFILQKIFTFNNRSAEQIPQQFVLYSALSAAALGVSMLLLFVFVEVFHIWYLLAQVLNIGLVALGSFFVYRYVIFPKK